MMPFSSVDLESSMHLKKIIQREEIRFKMSAIIFIGVLVFVLVPMTMTSYMIGQFDEKIKLVYVNISENFGEKFEYLEEKYDQNNVEVNHLKEAYGKMNRRTERYFEYYKKIDPFGFFQKSPAKMNFNEGQIFCSKIHGHIIEFDENSPAKFKMKLKAVIEEFFSSEQNSSSTSQITSFFVGLLKRNIVGGPKNLQIWSWSHTRNIFNLPAAILAHQDLNFSNTSYVCEQPWNLDCVKISTTEMSSSSMQPKLCDENCFKEQTIICEKG